jgi:hypothetical protein
MPLINGNNDKSSIALDLETLSANYKSLLTKYKQAVLDYTDNLNTESARPCAKYGPDNTGIDQACYEEIWKNAGCTTTGKVNANSDWASKQTLNGLILDAWYWATYTSNDHRQGCYGTTEGSPYYILGIGTDGKLYMRKGLESDWSQVNDNTANDLASVCTGNDGKMIIASTKAKKVFYKDTYDASKWNDTKDSCCILSIAMGQDGTLVGVGTDNKLYSKPNLNGSWSKTASEGEFIKSICIAPDGSIFCIGNNDAVFKKNSYKNLASQSWQYMGNNTCCVKAITIAPDGTFIGVGTDNKLYIKDSYKNLNIGWKGPYKNSCCVVGITTIANPNYNGSIFSTAKSPNYKINAPSLTNIKGQTFWGTSGIKEAVSRSVQECSALCSSTDKCTGATFNPDKQYCWIRKGEGSTMPGLTNDYAIVPKSTQLLKIVESLNNELTITNRKMQSKIDEVYGIYGEQVKNRFDKNYSLINQYDNLNAERKKIDDVIKEYQTLEETENEMGLFITKNYYLFFIFFIVVLFAAIILAMLSLDPNTSSAVVSNVNNVVTNAKAVATNINPFYVMFGIILIVVVAHLYNQYITSIYKNAPSFKGMGQLGIVYFVFIIGIIFVAITYFTKK